MYLMLLIFFCLYQLWLCLGWRMCGLVCLVWFGLVYRSGLV